MDGAGSAASVAAARGSSALTKAALRARSGQFDLEDVQALSLDALGISLLLSPAICLFQCINLVSLSMARNELKSVEGFDAFVNLERLDLSDNKIAHVSPLAACTKLRTLLLAGNAITDTVQVESLKPLTELRVLSLGGRGNPVAVSDRHVPIVRALFPQLIALDDGFVSTWEAMQQALAAATVSTRNIELPPPAPWLPPLLSLPSSALAAAGASGSIAEEAAELLRRADAALSAASAAHSTGAARAV